MLFNSLEFLVFLPIVLITYYSLPHRKQNVFLVLASCFFYASWDWRFLLPLLFSTTIDYACAVRMERSANRAEPLDARKKYLYFSLITNLGLLGFFKYFNFFVDTFHELLLTLGISVPVPTLQIILPVGISFYTFQALSYTIDVYRGKLHATQSFWDFFLAVLFFPHLVAGPIQRAANLISQVVTPRRTTRDQVFDGLNLILWGYFKKTYIADGLAPIVNTIYAAPSISGGEVLVGTLAFAFQIYCDFSGYTDIARGVAKLLGFEFMLNFNLPYFAANPSDFWRRWHISLSSWLRDYLYIPLGGNQHGPRATYRNLMLTMILGGLWHGAAWNFVLWGIYHGSLLAVHRLASPALERIQPNARSISAYVWLSVRIALMFTLTCYGWLLFRATSLDQVIAMTQALSSPFNQLPAAEFGRVMVLVAPLIVVQLIQFSTGRLEFWRLASSNKTLYAALSSATVYCIVFLGATPQSFVYFQF